MAEFHEIATQLTDDLRNARLAGFAAVMVVMGAIGFTLFAIVLRGSWTIDRQMAELQSLSRRNNVLRLRVQQAAGRVAALNDGTIKRIGADLHDGPVQLLGFAALRLDALRAALPEGAARTDPDAVERAVRGSITEIRLVARGLSLPDIARRPLDALLRALAEAHAERTGAAVTPKIDAAGADLPVAARTAPTGRHKRG